MEATGDITELFMDRQSCFASKNRVKKNIHFWRIPNNLGYNHDSWKWIKVPSNSILYLESQKPWMEGSTTIRGIIKLLCAILTTSLVKWMAT